MSVAPAVGRRASLLPVLGLMYASMCGGPYGTEDFVAKIGPGAFVVVLFLTPWIWGIPLALATAELSIARPVGGGYYRWVLHYLGPFWGFQSGVWSLISSFLDNALYPVLFARAVSHFFPGMGRLEEYLVAVAFIGTLTWINHRGIRLAGGAALALNAFLILPLVWLCFAAFRAPRFSALEPFFAPGIDVSAALGTTLALAMWLYSGYFEVSTVAEEIESPARNIPRGLVIVTPFVVLSYALPTIAGLVASGGWSEWRSGQFSTIGRELGGAALGTWLFLGSAASQAVVFLTYLLWWSRLAWAMAREGQLPRAMARLSPRFGTPSRTLWGYALIYSVLVLLPFEDLLVADIWLSGALVVLVQASLVRSRRDPAPPGAFRIPGGRFGLWLNAALPTLTWLALIALTTDSHGLLSAGVILVGPVLYYATEPFRRHAAATDQNRAR
ncbi:MAG TPA: APC family permease [Vicinamibacteria bacterium]|nr:APC family permease [Vicinamibacteria bacterium]